MAMADMVAARSKARMMFPFAGKVEAACVVQIAKLGVQPEPVLMRPNQDDQL
jgi:hypothetical protein